LKNLKTISLYNTIIIILIIILGITYYRIKQKTVSKYTNESEITGIINDIKKSETNTQIELIGKEKILITYGNEIDYKLGDKIRIKGTLEKPNNNTIFNLFNYRKYLKSKKINYIFKADEIELINKNKKIKYKIKNIILDYIHKFKSEKYLKTFILGTNEIEENTKNSYKNNGISHLFCVSGMHFSLFGMILKLVLDKITTNEKVEYPIIICFFMFFAFLTNYTPSVLRTVLLYIMLSINKILELNLKTIYLMLIDLIILLLYNPYYIYNTGFIYSFTISSALIIFSNIINNYKNYMLKVLMTSIISFIIGIPITINNYFEINLLSPLINIIFVPIVSFIIFPLSLITLLVKPLDNLFYIVTIILEQMSLKIANINGNIILSHIPWYIMIIYYLNIYIFLKGIKNRQILKLIPLIVLIIIHYNIEIISNIYITTLDVGQGDSILIKIKNKNILIDTSGKLNSKKSEINNKTIPYLKSQGIKKINYLIITHGDYDHMGEAINLVNNFKVEKVIFNCGTYNDLEKDLIKILNRKKIPYYSCIKELKIDNNKLYFLQTKEYDNENDNSNVIYTELAGYKFMFMGDASVTTEKEILNKYNLSDIDVLKVGHHGSRTSSSKEFINEINPKYSVISVGKNNRYGHPNKEVLDNLNDSKVYRTDQDGSIMFKIKNNKLKIETCSP
jgi:competence protein ComEC